MSRSQCGPPGAKVSVPAATAIIQTMMLAGRPIAAGTQSAIRRNNHSRSGARAGTAVTADPLAGPQSTARALAGQRKRQAPMACQRRLTHGLPRLSRLELEITG
jgi:hypothetical protein